MRLTLRTMLAYLDDVLSESDAAELASKIERSDFASGLVHKIRNSIGRLRLSSPQLLGHDLMDDPNTVAEFIDSALPPDKEQDFEKVCLQSDKHLAEVASCHQILALVLGTPARVDSKLRERVYRTAGSGVAPSELGTGGNGDRAERLGRADQVDVATQLVGDADSGLTPRSLTVSDSQPEFAPVRPSRGLWPIGMGILVGFLLIVGLVIAIGPRNKNSFLLSLLGGSVEEPAANEPPAVATRVQPLPGDPVATSSLDTAQAENQANVPPAPGAPPADRAPVPLVPNPQTAWPQLNDTLQNPVDTSQNTVDNGAPRDANQFVPDPLVEQSADLIDAEDAFAQDSVDPSAAFGPLESLETPPAPAEAAVPAETTVQSETGNPPLAELDDEAETAVNDTANLEQLADVGQFLSENEVLVVWDEQSGWTRLPGRSALDVGQRLRSLPIYRPQLLLSQSNVQVSLRGRTELTFDPSIDLQTPLLLLPYGQLLMNSIGPEKSRVAFRTGERLLVIEFTERDSELAILAERVLLPGSDPQQEPPHSLVQIWVTRGMVKIDEGGTTQEVAAGNRYESADNHAARLDVFTELPEWAYSRIDEVDRAAAAELETLLPVGRDLALSLHENAAHRRTDVRSLSTRCLVALDDFETGAALFSEADKRYQFAWPALFDELRAAIARGPQTADDVYRAFEKLYGGDAGELYRMLMGYTDEQLAAGVAAELVENLDNDRVEFRILAFENLKRMTDKTYLYAPTQSEKLRHSRVARWRTELRKGKVTMREVPSSLADWQRLSTPGT